MRTAVDGGSVTWAALPILVHDVGEVIRPFGCSRIGLVAMRSELPKRFRTRFDTPLVCRMLALRTVPFILKVTAGGATGWAPIMGVGYSKNVTQWSSGEYNDANTRENDLAIITSSVNGIRYRDDDHSSSLSEATRLTPNQEKRIDLDGLINRSSDQDAFVFESVTGELYIRVQTALRGANLDIKATLYDGDGNEIETSNPQRSLHASMCQLVNTTC